MTKHRVIGRYYGNRLLWDVFFLDYIGLGKAGSISTAYKVLDKHHKRMVSYE